MGKNMCKIHNKINTAERFHTKYYLKWFLNYLCLETTFLSPTSIMWFCIYKTETYKLKIYLSRMLEADRVFSILENSRFFSNMAYSSAD